MMLLFNLASAGRVNEPSLQLGIGKGSGLCGNKGLRVVVVIIGLHLDTSLLPVGSSDVSELVNVYR